MPVLVVFVGLLFTAYFKGSEILLWFGLDMSNLLTLWVCSTAIHAFVRAGGRYLCSGINLVTEVNAAFGISSAVLILQCIVALFFGVDSFLIEPMNHADYWRGNAALAYLVGWYGFVYFLRYSGLIEPVFDSVKRWWGQLS